MEKIVLDLSSEYSGWIASLLSRGLMEHQTSYMDMIPVPEEVVEFIKKYKEQEENK
jgi:hypothetical protein